MAPGKTEKSNTGEGKKCEGAEEPEKVEKAKIKDQTKQKVQKKAACKGKAPGWLKDSKFLYSDDFVKDLVKKTEVPGVGDSCGGKNTGKRPQHKAKVQIKLSEALLKEAIKVHEVLDKLEVKIKEEKVLIAKEANAEEPKEPKGKEIKSEVKVEKKSKTKSKMKAK